MRMETPEETRYYDGEFQNERIVKIDTPDRIIFTEGPRGSEHTVRFEDKDSGRVVFVANGTVISEDEPSITPRKPRRRTRT